MIQMGTKLHFTFEELYKRCIFASAAHAVANLKFPFFSYEQSWDGDNYSFKMSSEGTISFDFSKKIIAGAGIDNESPRFMQYPEFQAIELFSDAPDRIRHLAEREALQYLRLTELLFLQRRPHSGLIQKVCLYLMTA